MGKLKHVNVMQAKFYIEEVGDKVILRDFKNVLTQRELEKLGGIWDAYYEEDCYFYACSDFPDTIEIWWTHGDMRVSKGDVISKTEWKIALLLMKEAGKRLHKLLSAEKSKKEINI